MVNHLVVVILREKAQYIVLLDIADLVKMMMNLEVDDKMCQMKF